ncbi:hypothetical protein [Acinetobacter thermotolerans]|uniref:hypothetical protein n=1 Tax=Acinetobacter thermotolerans TaxID=3151487 RepID=UPI00325B3163
MSDRYKPFKLTATFLVEAEPSELTVSYDLHAIYLGVPETELPVTQYINSLSFFPSQFGDIKLVFTQFTIPSGFSALSNGNPKIENRTSYVRPTGFNGNAFGRPGIINFNKNTYPTGFNSSLYGRPIIYNLRQYLLVPGRSMGIYGTAYVQGGVKEVRGSGFNSAVLPQPKVINTRADQYVDLRTPSRGIAPPTIDRPNVSPRILYPMGILPGNLVLHWYSVILHRKDLPMIYTVQPGFHTVLAI